MNTNTKLGTLGHVGRGTGAVEPFDQRFSDGKLVTPEEIKNGASLSGLVIWGGEDISPSLYRSPLSPSGHGAIAPSSRDRLEATACLAAIRRGIPIIGVCRGAQLLCALAGGKLIQDVDGHFGNHKITTDDGREMITSSVHHQMLYPWDVEHELIAWSTNRRSSHYETGDGQDEITDRAAKMVEPEIVYFPKIKGLAIQGHPEFMRDDCEFVQYCMELVDRFFATSVDAMDNTTATEV